MAGKLDRLIRDFRWGRMDEVAAGQMALALPAPTRYWQKAA